MEEALGYLFRELARELIQGLSHRTIILGRVRGTLKREPLLNPLLALLNRDLIHRVYIPKGAPNPLPEIMGCRVYCDHQKQAVDAAYVLASPQPSNPKSST